MTDLRQAAKAVVDRWDSPKWEWSQQGPTADLMAALRTALEQPEQEPVAHSVIAGALFDVMGWLTTRKERLVLSSVDDASPAVVAITEFAKMRGLSLNDSRVQDWQDYTTPPAAQRSWVGLTDEEVKHEWEVWRASLPRYMCFAQGIETKLKERNNG